MAIVEILNSMVVPQAISHFRDLKIQKNVPMLCIFFGISIFALARSPSLYLYIFTHFQKIREDLLPLFPTGRKQILFANLATLFRQ